MALLISSCVTVGIGSHMCANFQALDPEHFLTKRLRALMALGWAYVLWGGGTFTVLDFVHASLFCSSMCATWHLVISIALPAPGRERMSSFACKIRGLCADHRSVSAAG